MRRRRDLALGIDLENGWAGNDILVVELSLRLREDDIHLANGTRRDSVDLVVLITSGDANLNGELHETGEENSIDRCVFSDAELRLGGSIRAGKGY